MAQVISADEIKKSLPNYSPDKAEEFHGVSAKQADKEFKEALKNNPAKEAILLNGGTASGKSEFIATQLKKEQCIIFDATLYTPEGARNKIRQIKKANKIPVIYSVIPDDLRRAFIAFLNRDRKFSDTHFYRTHAGSRSTLLWIAKEYPDIEINIIESSYTKDDKLQFAKIDFNAKDGLINYLTGIQMSENDIISYVNFLEL